MSVKSAIALLDGFVAEGVVVEVTHRAARRLFGLKALGEEVRKAVRPPDRPQPGRGPGRPRTPVEEEDVPVVAASLPPLSVVTHSLQSIDYSALEAAMAHADQVIRVARQRLRGISVRASTPEIQTPERPLVDDELA